LTIQAVVGKQARAQITSTGATRVYRQRAGQPTARQDLHFTVQEGGLLEYIPDPLIPFAQACYCQQTRIELAPDAGLFYWEVVAPGRAAKGELFQYQALQLNLEIIAAGQPIAWEQLQLIPSEQPVTSPLRLGPFHYFGTFYLCRVGVAPLVWQALYTALRALADRLSTPGAVLWGVTPLVAHGLLVRVLSDNGRAIQAGLPTFWQLAKQALYQADVELPRKIY
jgi:urease accessory protein